jgi:hypothetical protein
MEYRFYRLCLRLLAVHGENHPFSFRMVAEMPVGRERLAVTQSKGRLTAEMRFSCGSSHNILVRDHKTHRVVPDYTDHRIVAAMIPLIEKHLVLDLLTA